MYQTPIETLITQLMNTDLATSLETIYDLALYESGEALLGKKQKNALQDTQEFIRILQTVDKNKLIELIK